MFTKPLSDLYLSSPHKVCYRNYTHSHQKCSLNLCVSCPLHGMYPIYEPKISQAPLWMNEQIFFSFVSQNNSNFLTSPHKGHLGHYTHALTAFNDKCSLNPCVTYTCQVLTKVAMETTLTWQMCIKAQLCELYFTWHVSYLRI